MLIWFGKCVYNSEVFVNMLMCSETCSEMYDVFVHMLLVPENVHQIARCPYKLLICSEKVQMTMFSEKCDPYIFIYVYI